MAVRFSRAIFAIAIMCALNSSPAMAYDETQLRQLLDTKKCAGCDLAGADLANANL
jgi:hypothetical protein